MELAIAIIVSGVTGLLKWLVTKLGADKAKWWASFFVLASSFVAAWLYTNEIVTVEMAKQFAKLALMAVGWYELVWNRVLKPAFDNMTK